ncbi:MAG: ribonuclease E/G, partial [Xanthobacteraceae bacterium]
RSVSSLALQVLRALEEQLMKGSTHNLIARTRPDVALYVLNQKRAHLRSLEERFAITITISADESVAAPQAFVIDRGEQVHTPEAAKALAERTQADAAPLEDEDDLEDFVAAEDESADEAASPTTVPEQGEGGARRKRRRRRRGGRNGGGEQEGYQPHDEGSEHGHADAAEHDHDHAEAAGSSNDFAADGDREAAEDDEPAEQAGEFAQQGQSENSDPNREGGERRRRRGRRGGRRNRHRNGGERQDNWQESQHESHDGQPDGSEETFASAEELSAATSAEPELSNAVADLEASPPPPRKPRVSAEAPAASPAAEGERVRRRSTVRERAPVSSGDETAAVSTPSASAAPEPAATDNNGEAAGDQPRRTGWWSRRFAGS